MRIALLLVPLLTLVGSYLALALDEGALWLWDRLIHESGVRSFRDTVFYFDHALREIPVDFFLGLTVGVAAGTGRVRKRAAWGALLVFLFIFMGGIVTTDVTHCIEEFAQSRTRHGATPEWGCALAVPPAQPTGADDHGTRHHCCFPAGGAHITSEKPGEDPAGVRRVRPDDARLPRAQRVLP